jgi:ABC-2 type transport system ATP-binding protein
MLSAAHAIDVRELSKSYPVPRPFRQLLRRQAASDSVLALDRVSFAVEAGEVLGLLGPNGAGKTTLINILCTLLTPSSGEVRIEGHDVQVSPELLRRRIGLVTSNERSFYWRLTGRQNLRFFAELYHVPAVDVERRIEEFIAALDLRDFVDRRFDGYSTGIRQRFAFARALLHRPRILFMDEPTKGLDPNASAALLQLIRERILHVWQPTVIITSHNLTEIETLCGRVAIIDRGRMLRIGTLADLARSIRSHEAYAVQVAAADGGLLDGLKTLLGHDRVRARDGVPVTLELGLEDGERGLSEALRCILDHGAVILRCEPMEISLADIFRQTVQRRSAP